MSPDQVSIASIRQRGPAEDTSGGEERAYLTEAQLKSLRYEQRTKHFEAEHAARIDAIRSMTRLVKVWLAFVAALLVAQGFLAEAPFAAFKLTDNVVLAVLGVTTVNVLGLVLVGAKYLFAKEARWMEDPYSGGGAKRL